MDSSTPKQNIPQNTPQDTSVINQPQNPASNTAQTPIQSIAVAPKDQLKTIAEQSVSKIPISGASKETGPVGHINNESIALQVTEQEPVLSPEVKEVGVVSVKNSEQINIKPDVSAAGVEVVKTAVPVQTMPSGNIQLPMTEEEAKKAIKTHRAADAAYGLGTEVLKYLRRLHRGLFNKIS